MIFLSRLAIKMGKDIGEGKVELGRDWREGETKFQ